MLKALIIFFIISSAALQLYSQVNQEWVRIDSNLYSSYDIINNIALDNNGNIFITGRNYTGNFTGEISLKKISSKGAIIWFRTFHDSLGRSGETTNIIIDHDQYVYISGAIWDTAQYYKDLITIKYDTAGSIIWKQCYSGSPNGILGITDMKLDNNRNVIVTGTSGGSVGYDFDYCTIKYDASGNQLWVKKYDGIGHFGDEAYGICFDNNNNVIITGESCNTYGWNPSDITTIKYSENGDLMWIKRFTGYYQAAGFDIKADNNNNIYVTGYIEYPLQAITIKYNQNGDTLWTTKTPGVANRIELDQNKNVYITGYTPALNGYRDYLIAKYDNYGFLQWLNKYNGPFNDNDHANGMYVSSIGDVYVTGTSRDSADNYTEIATLKYLTNGSLSWQARYRVNLSSSNVGKCISVKDNNAYVSGFNGSNYITIKYSQPIGIHPISSEIPNHFSLSQNYPNPFNPSTKLKFDTPKSAYALLKVYDILGREVTTIVNEHLKPGTYEVDFDGSNLQSGVYFYKLVVGDNTNNGGFDETKKMILLK